MELNQLSRNDKTVGIMLLFCFVFWFLSKTEVAGFVLFGVVYEIGVFPMIIVTIVCAGYFFYQWFKNKFTLNKIYFYGFLLAIVTLLIMRFVFSITSNGIILMPNYNN